MEFGNSSRSKSVEDERREQRNFRRRLRYREARGKENAPDSGVIRQRKSSTISINVAGVSSLPFSLPLIFKFILAFTILRPNSFSPSLGQMDAKLSNLMDIFDITIPILLTLYTNLCLLESPLNYAYYNSDFSLKRVSDCIFCGAKRFEYEPLGFCCSQGQVVLTSTKMPTLLKDLFIGSDNKAKQFQSAVRTYNNTFAFTSIGIYNYDKDLCKRNKGIYTFKVQGQIYHFVNDLLPDGTPPRNLQLYFFDTEHQIEKRIQTCDRLDKEIVSNLVEVMSSNPYAQFFKSLKDICNDTEFSIKINTDPKLDQRVYNAPTTSQIAAIWIEDSYAGAPESKHIRVYAHSGRSQSIQYFYGCYDPLQYPLLFPHGDVGWHARIDRIPSNVQHSSSKTNQPTFITPDVTLIHTAEELVHMEEINFEEGRKRKTVSCREYYAYKFQIRESDKSYLLHSGRLLQQFIVDVYIKIETQRLDYYRLKQLDLRSETYQGLIDSVHMGMVYGEDIGQRVILPASFIGGPRDMRKRYLDAMAIVQQHGKPDLFVTITCNPNWPEIKELLQHRDEAQNRPDIVCRAFHARLREFKNDIIKKKYFGTVAAYIYVIEFQKRGLPHAHFLIILETSNKIDTPSSCDKFVCAEIPDPKSQPRLYALVKKHMIHGPCGILNPNCPCMIKKKGDTICCRSKYPRSLCDETSFGEDSYPTYRRRTTPNFVNIRGHELDNRWVVPYNPQLLLKFDCHINVEICASVKSVKYIYKYVYKGHDKISVGISTQRSPCFEHDEIKEFQNARWVSAPEAAWRIFAFPIAEMHPSVVQLQIHLENFQYINFFGNQRIMKIIKDDNRSSTMLTKFFEMNSHDLVAKRLQLFYIQFPEHFVWSDANKAWTQRQRKNVIGRLVSVNPTEGERYYLRLLLQNVRAPTSFDSLKLVDGQSTSTFREAAEKMGLLTGNFCIDNCLEEAIVYQLPQSLRKLFAILMVFCEVPDPKALWEKYKSYMCEDYSQTRLYNQTEMESIVLNLIGDIMEKFGKSIHSYHLNDCSTPLPIAEIQAREIRSERNLKVNDQDIQCALNLNIEQKVAFNTIMESVISNKSGIFFVDGPGGTGKTYLYRALLATTRSKKWIALATATSGIAASILPGGRTAHSRFKLPIDGDSKHTCNIGKQSAEAALLKEARLIIWDEVTMANRAIIEALDVTLKDLMNSTEQFGGKVIVFGGDLRQTLPVVRKGKKEDFINACIVKSSHIWSNIKRLTLVENMRARSDPSFCQYLMNIGNGTEPTISGMKIQIPSQFVVPNTNSFTALSQLITAVYPDLNLFQTDPYQMMGRVILTTTNDYVDEINAILITKFPGEPKTLLSYDEALDSNYRNNQDYLHTLSFAGLPPHTLVLKKNCPVILLRNLNPCEGLCNGTRLICNSFSDHLISCYIAIGEYKRKHVFIPRIPLETSRDEHCSIPFKRNQFPVKLCFAMTINKSQGQTLDFAGIYLKQPVFSHGQLYVAMSRAKNADSIKMVIHDDLQREKLTNMTANIVYKEILEYILQ